MASLAIEDGGRGRDEEAVGGLEIAGGRDTEEWVDGAGLELLAAGLGVDAWDDERDRGGLGRGRGLSLELLRPSEVSCTLCTARNWRLADFVVDLGVFCGAEAELDEGLSCTEFEGCFT